MAKRTRRATLLAILIFAVLVTLPSCGAKPASQAGYTERALKLISNVDGAPAELTVRFYDEAPNVPYFGLAQYKELVHDDKTTVESDGKVASLTSTDGDVVTVSDAEDKLTSNDLAAFRIYLAPQQQAGKPYGFLDLGTPFVRVRSVEYEGQAQPITLDYGAYDIDLRVDEHDAYLPLACESDLLATASCAALFYNGTNLYLTNRITGDMTTLDPTYYQKLEANHERPQDMVDFTYNNLCFLMDNLAGNTKSDMLGSLVAQLGFDKALDHDEATRKTRELLKSNDFYEFLAGTQYLFSLTANGHTVLADTTLTQSQAYLDSELMKDETFFDALEKTDLTSSFMLNMDPVDETSIRAQRTAILGEEPPTYQEQGTTAVIILDSFMSYDADGWTAHYEDGASIPTTDIVGTLVSGLKQAKANPKIKNVVIDISCNGGGYNELLAAVEAILLKRPELRVYDQLNQQAGMVNYEADSLFDGSFNSSALADETSFNFALLTSRASFSCGNAFAEHCRDAGIPILGEPSNGGEFMVVPTFFPEGLNGYVSAGAMKMIDASGSGNESGVPVDVNLVKTDASGTRDYSDFYNLARLDEVMSNL